VIAKGRRIEGAKEEKPVLVPNQRQTPSLSGPLSQHKNLYLLL